MAKLWLHWLYILSDRLLYPVEVFCACSNLEVIFDDSDVYLGVSGK